MNRQWYDDVNTTDALRHTLWKKMGVVLIVLFVAFWPALYFGTELMSLFVTTEGRPLTLGEKELASEIFSESVNYDDIKIYKENYFPIQRELVVAPDGNMYYPSDGWWYSDDISTLDINKQALFLHEVTHVWQYQSGRRIHIPAFFQHALRIISRGSYDQYALPSTLSIDRSYADYNTEQQGDIVRNYFYITKGYRGKGDETPIEVYESILPFLNKQ